MGSTPIGSTTWLQPHTAKINSTRRDETMKIMRTIVAVSDCAIFLCGVAVHLADKHSELVELDTKQ